MNRLPGVSGTLLPNQFLASALAPFGAPDDEGVRARKHRQLQRLWLSVERACGPASGLRALFDHAAMPLFGSLGFRASRVTFDRSRVTARLDTPGGALVALVILPWAARASTAWRELIVVARAMDAPWCFLFGPPFLSLVDARGHASRRSLDFTLPDVFHERSFSAFWTLAHASAFDRTPGRIDAVVAAAARFQDVVRADLQRGVTEALRAFASVLPARGGGFDESLTLVYRILFLLFAESRDLVPRSHSIYRGAYAMTEQCRAAAARAPIAGLWDGLAAISRLSRVGCRVDDLIVTPFNGRLFARASARALESGRPVASATPRTVRRDAATQRALMALGFRRGNAGIEGINYADLGVEQLGAVYERVLDLDPEALRNVPASLVPTARARGHSARRKQSGTFYTPQSLAEFVVRRTLGPLVAGASPDEILALRVVDPAMGSGAFLVAACRFLAVAYARALVDSGQCAEADLDEAEHANCRRRVAERCLAGVDANPVAVQLARLSLWLTTLARGKPLGFLDHRLRSGNSLIGASPDDLRRLTMRRTAGDQPLFDLEAGDLADAMSRVARPLIELATRRDDTIDDVRAKEAAWDRVAGERSPLNRWRAAADLWCARWFWPERPPSPAETRAALDALLRGDQTLGRADLKRWLERSRRLAHAHSFFHWPLEFADVFYEPTGDVRDRPGFDAVIGNPPWEMLRGERTPGVVLADAGEKRLPALFLRFIRDSGLYPSCDRGHLNLYQPFLERALSLARPGGRVGLILPWGLAVDDGAAALRSRLIDRSTIDTLVGLDNAAALFPIHRGMRFLGLITRAGGRTREARARFGVRTAAELDDLPARDDPTASAYPIRLTPDRLSALGGRTRRIPDLRSPADLALLEHLASVGPALGSAEGWNAHFGRELNITDDRDAFGPDGLPVIEGKHLQPFSVDRSASRLRIGHSDARRLLPDRRFERARLAYRDVSAVGNRITLIAAIVPKDVVTTHTVFCLRTPLEAEVQSFLCGLLNSYVLNAYVRMLMGGHLTTSLIEDVPAPVWTGDGAQRRVSRLARRLARFPHSPGTNAALQAAVAHLYRLDLPMFRHVLAGFPLVPESERRRACDAFVRRLVPSAAAR